VKRSTVPIDSIKPHPRNYRRHPSAQVDAIRQSLDAFGQYRDVVVSSDGVILAGHGVWLARKAQGAKTIGEVRMDFPHTDPRAEKLMVADNELTKGADDDEAQLAALLADIQRTEGLDGTGWDDRALDALIGEMAAENYFTRDPESAPRIPKNDSSAWGGAKLAPGQSSIKYSVLVPDSDEADNIIECLNKAESLGAVVTRV